MAGVPDENQSSPSCSVGIHQGDPCRGYERDALDYGPSYKIRSLQGQASGKKSGSRDQGDARFDSLRAGEHTETSVLA